MATDIETVSALVRSISEPVFVIIPGRELPDEDLIKIFQSIENVLTQIEKKTNSKFDILIESAVYFGGYKEMLDIAQEQGEDLGGEIITE